MHFEIVTDIIETPPAQFQPIDPTDRTRPVPGGISIGNPLDTGTIGGWVWDKDDDTIVMLSNDHVFGHTAGDCIMQPGPVQDGGTCVSDRIGEVKRGIAQYQLGRFAVVLQQSIPLVKGETVCLLWK